MNEHQEAAPCSAFATQVGGTHYADLAIQPTEYCQLNRLGFCESSVVKYVSRHKAKDGRRDIEKAIHFLQLLLEIEYKPKKPYPPEMAPKAPISARNGQKQKKHAG